MSNLDLNDWLLFTRIADSGGLSAASRRMGLPKSTLSRRLARLEQQFGARLINRRGRTFELTAAGRLLYAESQRLSEQVAGARERLAVGTGRAGGTIRMTAPKTPGGRFLGAWLAHFLAEYPDIRIELDLNDRVVSLHEQGYDLALRVGPLADSTLVARSLGSSERMLVAAPDVFARHDRPAAPAQLEGLPCIGFGEQNSGIGTWSLQRGRRVRQVRFEPILRCDDMATILQVCRGGAGIALIPDFVCHEALQAGELERVLPDWRGPAAQFYLLYPERRLLPERVRLLVDFLVACSKTGQARR